MSATADVVVVGGGVIGQAIAWRVARRGQSVTVCDPDPGRAASWAAAGMLAPVTEHNPGEAALTELGLASLRRWPSFADELAEDGGVDVGLRTEGTLSVAFDEDDRRALTEVVAWQRTLGLDSDWLTSRECRELEPFLSPRVTGGALARGDHQVDNRAVLAALEAAGRRHGVALERQEVYRVLVDADRASGVELADGTRMSAGTVVVAAGPWSGQLGGLPLEARPPVRPVHGAILRLRADPSAPVVGRTVRAGVQGWHVYLVPRTSGELVVGASMEEAGFDTRVRAGAVADLLRAAVAVLPAVGELELAETIARLRPGSPDNGPILGRTPVEGLVLATGHHRNGILLTPVTADALDAVLRGEPLPGPAAAFALERFA